MSAEREARLLAKLAEVERERDDLRARKDEAYLERNQCVALIARMAIALGYRAGTARTAIEDWSDDWHGCVYIDLPAGQVSWHYHDSQAHLFDWLPPYCGDWDGHDTPEKYQRVLSRTPLTDMRAALRAMAECERLREVIEKVDWVWIRSVLAQGASIYQDYQAGTHKTYEHYSSRLDVAAVERKEELQTVMRDALEEA